VSAAVYLGSLKICKLYTESHTRKGKGKKMETTRREKGGEEK